MRIAIFSDNFYPEISGISDSIILTSKELAKRGNEITIYVPRYVRRNYQKVNLPEKEIDLGENIRIIRLPSIPFRTGTGQGRAAVPLGFSLKSIWKSRPDVIHVHLPFGAGLEGLMASMLFGIPLVGTEHTFMKGVIGSRFVRKIVVSYNSWFFRKCKFLSSPAKFMLSDDCSQKKDVIPNPIDLLSFKDSKQNREKHGLPGFAVLYCGGLADYKHIDLVIKAIAKAKESVPDIKFAIVGIGAEEKSLRLLVRKLNLEKEVSFLGYIRGKELSEIYKSCDVFATMSAAEVHSLAVMQAMASAMPVIATNANGLKECVNPGTGFLIEPGDIDELAGKIVFLCKNPEIKKKMGENGLKFVENLSPSKIAKRWEEAYRAQKVV